MASITGCSIAVEFMEYCLYPSNTRVLHAGISRAVVFTASTTEPSGYDPSPPSTPKTAPGFALNPACPLTRVSSDPVNPDPFGVYTFVGTLRGRDLEVSPA